MKRLGRVLGSLLAVALTVFSMQVFAAAQTGGRDFNHMTTGFILSGGHAVAACETCHIGGVFKGTPRTCDGCHATGKRIIATPKSNNHVVTDAQCDSCHFNTATWLGARFNHGNAKTHQCETCHNGRIAQSKHSGHKITNKFCDDCHRSSSWVPASWNHTGAEYVSQDCATTCHNGTVARTYTNTAYHNSYTGLGITSCRSCHNNFANFYVERYLHNDAAYSAAAGCITCHDGTHAGVRGMPSNHIPLPVSASCNSCHGSAANWLGMNHNVVATIACYTCHGSNRAMNYAGSMDVARWPSFHESSKNPSATDCSASGCHRPVGSKGVLYQKWD